MRIVQFGMFIWLHRKNLKRHCKRFVVCWSFGQRRRNERKSRKMENEYLILNAGKAGDVITIAGVSVTSEGKDVKVMAASIANTLNANVDFIKSYTASAKEGSVDITKNDNVTADPGVAVYTGDAAVVSGTVDGDTFTVTSKLTEDELALVKGEVDERIEEITSEAKKPENGGQPAFLENLEKSFTRMQSTSRRLTSSISSTN